MKRFYKLFQPEVLVAGVAVAIVSAFSVALATPTKSTADGCSNDVICNGISSGQDLVNVFNSDPEVRAIYSSGHFGNLSADNGVSRAATQMIEAKSFKDGRTVLQDGTNRVVFTNGKSLGREGGFEGHFNPFTINIGGKDYHWGFNSTALGQDGMRTLVLMDKDNVKAQFAVLTSCGNPIIGEQPEFHCDKLNREQIDRDTFEFWTEATAENGATITNLHYDFGDGETFDTSDKNERVSHDFAPGDHTITVVITYNINGVEHTEPLQMKCKVKIKVEKKKEKKPNFACTDLKPIALGDLKFKFVGKAEFKNAELISGKFDFGDGTTAAGTITSTGEGTADITSPEHKFAEFTGTRTITLDLTFDLGKDEGNDVCETKITHEIKGEQAPPKEIPRAGATELLATAAGVSGLGAAGAYYRASRKNLHGLIDKFKR